MVSLKNISKSYGDKRILDDVSVDFPRGKITSLIGGNGTGKSTLLSIVSRLIPKDKGDVFIIDENITNLDSKELAKKLSILKQSNHSNIRLTIRELVCFGRFPYTRGKRLCNQDCRIVREAIEYMSLEEIQDSYIDELSGGQKQRAFLAMVIAQDTDYILLDEPLNNLDMKHSVQIMKILKKLAKDLNKTIIIIIHDINYASCYSDYIATVKNGKISHFGTTDKIIQTDVLKDVFDIDFEIMQINGNKICLYFV